MAGSGARRQCTSCGGDARLRLLWAAPQQQAHSPSPPLPPPSPSVRPQVVLSDGMHSDIGGFVDDHAIEARPAAWPFSAPDSSSLAHALRCLAHADVSPGGSERERERANSPFLPVPASAVHELSLFGFPRRRPRVVGARQPARGVRRLGRGSLRRRPVGACASARTPPHALSIRPAAVSCRCRAGETRRGLASCC